MPIDSQLMKDWFERDWADAMAQYEARKAAPRQSPWLGAPGPDSEAALQAELFAPLFSEYAPILGSQGRGTVGPTMPGKWTAPMNLGGGEVLQFDPVTGARRVLNPQRTTTTGRTGTTGTVKESPDMQMARRRVEMARKALLGARVESQRKTAQLELDAAVKDLNRLVSESTNTGNIIPPESPEGIMRETPVNFIGAPESFTPTGRPVGINFFNTNRPFEQLPFYGPMPQDAAAGPATVPPQSFADERGVSPTAYVPPAPQYQAPVQPLWNPVMGGSAPMTFFPTRMTPPRRRPAGEPVGPNVRRGYEVLSIQQE